MDIQKENEKLLAGYALLYHITNIVVSFDGGGDSGAIDSVAIMSKTPNINDMVVKCHQFGGREWDHVKNEWVEHAPTFKEDTLEKMIESIVEADLEDSNVDWYNNEGGYGKWIWTPEHGIEFDINVRITESQCAHQCERKLGYDEGETPEQEEAA